MAKKKGKISTKQQKSVSAFPALMAAAAIAMTQAKPAEAKSINIQETFYEKTSPRMSQNISRIPFQTGITDSQSPGEDIFSLINNQRRWIPLGTYIANGVDGEERTHTLYQIPDGLATALTVAPHSAALSNQDQSILFNSYGDVFTAYTAEKPAEDPPFIYNYLLLNTPYDGFSIQKNESSQTPLYAPLDFTQSKIQPDQLRLNYRRLAIVNAATEFGRTLPESHKFLATKFAETLNTFSDRGSDYPGRIESFVSFIQGAKDDLRQMAFEAEDNISSALTGLRLLALSIEESLESDNNLLMKPTFIPIDLPTLLSIFKTIDSIVRLIIDIRKKKTEKEFTSPTAEMGPTYNNAENMNIEVISQYMDSFKSRIRNLVSEFCSLAEDTSDPNRDLTLIKLQYSQRICDDLKAIKGFYSGQLPNVKVFTDAWGMFGCVQ